MSGPTDLEKALDTPENKAAVAKLTETLSLVDRAIMRLFAEWLPCYGQHLQAMRLQMDSMAGPRGLKPIVGVIQQRPWWISAAYQLGDTLHMAVEPMHGGGIDTVLSFKFPTTGPEAQAIIDGPPQHQRILDAIDAADAARGFQNMRPGLQVGQVWWTEAGTFTITQRDADGFFFGASRIEHDDYEKPYVSLAGFGYAHPTALLAGPSRFGWNVPWLDLERFRAGAYENVPGKVS